MAKLPEPIRDMAGRFRKIEERLRRLENSSPFKGSGLEVIDDGQTATGGSVVIPDDGVLIVDGGDIMAVDKAPSAQTLFQLGTQLHGDRGLTVFRDDGRVALEVRRPFSASDPSQNILIRDRQGGIIGGDSLLSPAGFDAPHIEMRFIPVDYTSSASAQSTSSTSFVATHEYRGFKQNPFLKPQFMVRCSDASTAAEVRIFRVGGSYLGGFLGSPTIHTVTVPAGTTTFTLFEFASGAQIPGAMSDALHLQVHARVTAGTGSVSVAPVRTIGFGY